MKLSIIVPVYNMNIDSRLSFCMESLLHQQLDEYEIIAVDDCSTDDSLKVLRMLEKQHSEKLKVIASPVNKRQGGAKNLGIKAAQGEWIGFVDSDDWVAPKMYAKLLHRAEETQADVVGCDYYITGEHSYAPGVRGYNNNAEQTGVLGPKQYRKLLLQPGSMVIKIYRRTLFTEHGLLFPENIFYEDNCTGPLIMLYASRFERVDEALYYYYQHDSSTVHHISEAKCEDRLKACKLFWEECRERGYLEQYREEIEYRFFELYYKNTLFSYMQGVAAPRISYVRKLKRQMLELTPEFERNNYYASRTDVETKKLIALHMKSTLLFMCVYKGLWMVRKLKNR